MPASKFAYLMFYDENLKPLRKLEYGEPVIAGSQGEYVVYVKNISAYHLVNLEFESDDVDLTFEPAVINELKPQEAVKLTLVWKPVKDRKTPLDASIKYVFNVGVKAEDDD